MFLFSAESSRKIGKTSLGDVEYKKNSAIAEEPVQRGA